MRHVELCYSLAFAGVSFKVCYFAASLLKTSVFRKEPTKEKPTECNETVNDSHNLFHHPIVQFGTFEVDNDRD